MNERGKKETGIYIIYKTFYAVWNKTIMQNGNQQGEYSFVTIFVKKKNGIMSN